LGSLPNEIEPIIEISSNSIYYFIAIIIGTIFLIYAVYKIIKWLIKIKLDKKGEILAKMRKMDWENPKEVAYKITKYGREIAGERSQKILDSLILELEPYKYRKDVAKISDEVKANFQIFLGVVENE
jgi:hypothetical protein